MFPNFLINGGFLPNLVITARPNGLDHRTCIMEIRILREVPAGQSAPKAATHRRLSESESWSDANELGTIGKIVNQDMGNMPFVQEGMAALKVPSVELGRYTERRIRSLHMTLRKYMEA